MGLIAFLAAKFGSWGLPEPLRKAAAWAAVAVAAACLLWSTKALYDSSVIERHETERAVKSIEGRDQAAEERAADVIRHTLEEREAQDAIRNGPAADAQRRLDCLRLERAGIEAAACGYPGGS